MGKKIPEVDAYIEKSAEFARPILKKLRRLFHKSSVRIEEVIKWGVPHFQCDGLIGGMAAFKQHATLGFWRAKYIDDHAQLFYRGPRASMCGIRITSIDDLPEDDTILDYMRQAIVLNAEQGKSKSPSGKPARPKAVRPTLSPELAAALAQKKHARAATHFAKLSPSCQREYVDWINEAKREATREKRLATTLEWLAAGKARNWKQEK